MSFLRLPWSLRVFPSNQQPEQVKGGGGETLDIALPVVFVLELLSYSA